MRSDTPLVLLAAAGDRLVRDTDLRRLRVDMRAFARWVDAGLWVQVVPGRYRSACTEPTFQLQVRAGAEWLGTHGALFGLSALRWLGISDRPDRPEWLVPRDRRWTPSWVTLHTTKRWDSGDVVTVRGVRTSTAARALIDHAASKPPARELEAMIERAIALRLTSVPTILRRLRALSGHGRHGVPLVRELLLDAGGESHLERRFLRLLRTSGFPRPETQVVMRHPSSPTARVDFLFRRERIVVEVSGRIGHSSDANRQKDARRRNMLQRDGYLVLEFTTADVIADPSYVLATLRQALSVMPLSEPHAVER